MQIFKKQSFFFLLIIPLAYAVALNLRLPFEVGEIFHVTKGYNSEGHIKTDEYAIDFSQSNCDAYRKKVLAVADGTVVKSVRVDSGGYGLYVIIEHENKIQSRSAHLAEIPENIQRETKIKRGDLIGYIGNTGTVTGIACSKYPGTHLHFAMYQKQADGTVVAYKPEPISGYTNLVAGMSVTSDNVLAKEENSEGFSSFFSEAVKGIGSLFSEEKPKEPIRETTPLTLDKINLPAPPEPPEEKKPEPGPKPQKAAPSALPPAPLSPPLALVKPLPPPVPPAPSGGTSLPESFTNPAPPPPTPVTPTSTPPAPEPDPTPTSTPPIATSTPPTPATSTPEIIFSADECKNSLSPDQCVIATTTITLHWSPNKNKFQNFSIACTKEGSPCPLFAIPPDAETTATMTLPEGDYTFLLRAASPSGETREKTLAITISSRPIVINEIGWMGTSAARDQDEWVELYNTASYSIDLSKIRLLSLTDNKPDILLSGVIAPKNFYLIERTDDQTISDIPAHRAVPFGSGAGAGLSNNGEILALTLGSSTILDQTPPVDSCGGWCGGSAPQFSSMERHDPYMIGSDKNNWGTWNNVRRAGKNADGLAVAGTPSAQNSISSSLAWRGSIVDHDMTLRKENSPYIMFQNIVVAEGATLTILPGTIIKFLSGGLTIRGTLNAKGAAADPIVITSLKDDAFGGDTNGDSASTTPTAGDWNSIEITGTANIMHTLVRFGGNPQNRFTPRGSIEADQGALTLLSSTVEYSAGYGIRLANATASIQQSTILHSGVRDDYELAGIFSHLTNLTLADSTIAENQNGLAIHGEIPGLTMNVSNNSFRNNTGNAIKLVGGFPTFADNTAEGNGLNGIAIRTLGLSFPAAFSGNLPYVVATYFLIGEEATLNMKPGVIVKFSALGFLAIKGILDARGTSDAPIIFTSLLDDAAGGDTNSDGASTTPAAGDWYSVSLEKIATSTFLYATFRYAGARNTNEFVPALDAIGTPIIFDHGLIEKNYRMGMRIGNTSAVITNSVFQNHENPENFAALYTSAANVRLEQTAFMHNATAIRDGGGSLFSTDHVEFSENTVNTVPDDLF